MHNCAFPTSNGVAARAYAVPLSSRSPRIPNGKPVYRRPLPLCLARQLPTRPEPVRFPQEVGPVLQKIGQQDEP
eukprot:6356192-Heterocapsa_arctica.AAC.1